MRCIALCTASSYALPAIADYFKTKQVLIKHYRNVLHLHILRKKSSWDIFIFYHGCIVMWGMKKINEQDILKQINKFSVHPLSKPETSSFIYRIGSETKITAFRRFGADVITIAHEEDNNAQLKLAISYGLAQSVKLESYEASTQKTIDNNVHIPNELASKGKIYLSRRSISKRIGEIFLERSSINLNSEYLDVPEYFWEYPHLESFYVMTEQFLDVPNRVISLNKKLDVLHEMFDMLNNQLEYRYSSMLEAVIILLIFIEIVINLIHFNWS